MADKKGDKPKKGAAGSLQKLYQVKDGQVVRLRQHCPKCGPGIFLAQHKNRTSCGHCGYTEFKKA
jgi:small subunit ribosomal protein S27Ae